MYDGREALWLPPAPHPHPLALPRAFQTSPVVEIWGQEMGNEDQTCHSGLELGQPTPQWPRGLECCRTGRAYLCEGAAAPLQPRAGLGVLVAVAAVAAAAAAAGRVAPVPAVPSCCPASFPSSQSGPRRPILSSWVLVWCPGWGERVGFQPSPSSWPAGRGAGCILSCEWFSRNSEACSPNRRGAAFLRTTRAPKACGHCPPGTQELLIYLPPQGSRPFACSGRCYPRLFGHILPVPLPSSESPWWGQTLGVV